MIWVETMKLNTLQQDHLNNTCKAFDILMDITKKRQLLNSLTVQSYKSVPTKSDFAVLTLWAQSFNNLLNAGEQLEKMRVEDKKRELLVEINELRQIAKAIKDSAQKDFVKSTDHSNVKSLQEIFKSAHRAATEVFSVVTGLEEVSDRTNLAIQAFKTSYQTALENYIEGLFSPVSIIQDKSFCG